MAYERFDGAADSSIVANVDLSHLLLCEGSGKKLDFSVNLIVAGSRKDFESRRIFSKTGFIQMFFFVEQVF